MNVLPSSHNKKYKGQALLLVLLVMSLVLTLILSSVSRSVTDVEISKYEDNAIRAFDAAQAGIEKAVVGLAQTSDPEVPLGNEAFYDVISESTQTKGNEITYPIGLISGESAIFWFVEHQKDADGNWRIICPGGVCTSNIPEQMELCWGNPGTPPDDNETPAIFIEFYYDSDSLPWGKFSGSSDWSTIRVTSTSADPYSLRTQINHFGLAVEDTGFKCSETPHAFALDFKRNEAGDRLKFLEDNGYLILFVKVTFLYNTNTQHVIGMKANIPGGLPSQGSIIQSTGRAGDVERKLLLRQGFPEMPLEFGSVMYAKKNTIKF